MSRKSTTESTSLRLGASWHGRPQEAPSTGNLKQAAQFAAPVLKALKTGDTCMALIHKHFATFLTELKAIFFHLNRRTTMMTLKHSSEPSWNNNNNNKRGCVFFGARRKR